MPVITWAKLRVTGRVQGVFYRQTAKEKARSLALGGWVRNTEDGAVEVEVSGPTDQVEQFIAWCKKGPPSAQVTAVEIAGREDREDKPDEHPQFKIVD